MVKKNKPVISHQDDLGYFKAQKVVRKKTGSHHGISAVELDDHAMSKILEGLNERIQKYEIKEIAPGGLTQDEQKDFDYFQELRDNFEQARNETL